MSERVQTICNWAFIIFVVVGFWLVGCSGAFEESKGKTCDTCGREATKRIYDSDYCQYHYDGIKNLPANYEKK